jgi:creatinine amidohydrolase/Fe(II)-dependent formamide hydrolase-like protein
VIGFPAAASAEKGERLLQAAADVVAEELQQDALWEPPAAR